MKHLIIIISLCVLPFIIQAQEYSVEYKVVCRRVVGCPVINGTCPTCVIIGKEGTVKKSRETIHREIDEWGEKMKKSLIIDYSGYIALDLASEAALTPSAFSLLIASLKCGSPI